MKNSNSKKNLASPNFISSENIKDGDVSRLKNVINFYRKSYEEKCDNANKDLKKSNRIYYNGDNMAFDDVQSTYKILDLPENVRSEMLEEMSDWELYINCKEYEEQSKPTKKKEYAIRNQNVDDIVIQAAAGIQYMQNCGLDENAKVEHYDTESWNFDYDAEKLKKSEMERALGNESFYNRDYEAASEHYTRSIVLCPNIHSFNNRAMSYIKLEKYHAAMRDVDRVLKIEPKNEKAIYRRALCFQGMHMYQEALNDFAEKKDVTQSRKCFDHLSKLLEEDIAKLSGKKYNIKENSNRERRCQVFESQLPAYANSQISYFLEVDKTGCAKSCVCGFCSEEDRKTRIRSTSLRIKERERWKLLTPHLLNEMQIPSSVTNEKKDFKEPLLNGNLTTSNVNKTSTKLGKSREEIPRKKINTFNSKVMQKRLLQELEEEQKAIENRYNAFNYLNSS